MPQTYPFDSVIKILTSNQKILSSDQTIVVINVASGKAVEITDGNGKVTLKRQRLAGFFQEYKYLLVSNNSDPRNEVEIKLHKIQLKDFDKAGLYLYIDLNYLVSCPIGNEVKIAEALWRGAHPGAVLNDHVNKWVKEFCVSETDFLENFFDRKHQLEHHLTTQASELGLTLRATVSLDDDQEKRPDLLINPINLPVRVRDDNSQINLRIEGQITIDPARKIQSILYRYWEPKLEELIREEVKKYCLGNVSLQSLYDHAGESWLQNNLTNHINSFLRGYGRQLGFFTVELTDGSVDHVHEQTFFETKADVKYEVLEYPDLVEIKNTVQMSLRDYALYKRSRAKNLQSWLEENLYEIIHQVLFGKRYIDLLLSFAPLERAIKQELSIRAEAIGYNVKQLITVPNLEPYEWLENFPVTVQGDFETSAPRFPVKLQIIAVARIRDLHDIEPYLNRRQNVPDLMKDFIHRVTTQALHAVDPERFYMQFFYCDEDEGEPVEKQLRDLLNYQLAEKFNAEIISIVFKMLDTEVTEIWSTLETSEGDLIIKLPSYSDVEEVIYKGTLGVDGIHRKGWNKFRRSRPDINKLCQRIAEHVASQLGTFSHADLVFTDFAGQQKVEYFVDNLAKKFALEEFGLLIRLNSLRRAATSIESREKQLLLTTHTAITEIEERIICEIKADAPAEKIQRLEEQKRVLIEKLPAGVKGARSNLLRSGEEKLPSPSRLPDVPTRRGLRGVSRGNSNGNGTKESE